MADTPQPPVVIGFIASLRAATLDRDRERIAALEGALTAIRDDARADLSALAAPRAEAAPPPLDVERRREYERVLMDRIDELEAQVARQAAEGPELAAAFAAVRAALALNGADLIAAERRRQVEVEGYGPEHDAGHAEELAMAGAAYAIPPADPDDRLAHWPWDSRYWKPTDDRIRELVKAGALIAAAIDARLSEAPTPEADPGLTSWYSVLRPPTPEPEAEA